MNGVHLSLILTGRLSVCTLEGLSLEFKPTDMLCKNFNVWF